MLHICAIYIAKIKKTLKNGKLLTYPSSLELPQQSSLEGGGVNCSDRAFEGRPSTLATGNER